MDGNIKEDALENNLTFFLFSQSDSKIRTKAAVVFLFSVDVCLWVNVTETALFLNGYLLSTHYTLFLPDIV